MEKNQEEKNGEKKLQPKIYVFQTDNRGMSPDYPFEFIPQSIQGNQKVCGVMGWQYVFREMKPEFFRDNHPAVGKIHMVREFLLEKREELGENVFLVFLDTDAWIQNASRLHSLLKDMCREEQKEKRGAYSRDPYIRKNTYINSGSFILRMDERAVDMYEELSGKLQTDPRFLREWPWDQVYVSSYVWENRDDFLIFKPDVLNTGYGKILRHNWYKTSRKIRDDLYYLCCFPVVIDDMEKGVVVEELDTEDFPNVEEKGYDYMDFD